MTRIQDSKLYCNSHPFNCLFSSVFRAQNEKFAMKKGKNAYLRQKTHLHCQKMVYFILIVLLLSMIVLIFLCNNMISHCVITSVMVGVYLWIVDSCFSLFIIMSIYSLFQQWYVILRMVRTITIIDLRRALQLGTVKTVRIGQC